MHFQKLKLSRSSRYKQFRIHAPRRPRFQTSKAPFLLNPPANLKFPTSHYGKLIRSVLSTFNNNNSNKDNNYLTLLMWLFIKYGLIIIILLIIK